MAPTIRNLRRIRKLFKDVVNDPEKKGGKISKREYHEHLLNNLDSMIESYSKKKLSPTKLLMGGGIWDVVNGISENVKNRISADMLKNYGKKAYQIAANEYRKKNCNGRARPLEVGELHPLCANFEGPGTRLDIGRNYPAYNGIDECSKEHDLEYEKIRKMDIPQEEKAKKIMEADFKVLKCYENYKDEEPYYSLGKLGISGKLGFEALLSSLNGKPTTLYGGCDECQYGGCGECEYYQCDGCKYGGCTNCKF